MHRRSFLQSLAVGAFCLVSGLRPEEPSPVHWEPEEGPVLTLEMLEETFKNMSVGPPHSPHYILVPEKHLGYWQNYLDPKIKGVPNA